MLPIHASIEKKLTSYYVNKNIPNILFCGPPGCGKSTLLNNFLKQIYTNENPQTLCLYVNCAHCATKGIKFIREELKMFAKIRTNSPGNIFKSVILINGDELTIDAQSALRRCIEIFSLSTRFFILAENKRRLMPPILSRFCEIHVPLPEIGGVRMNLHSYLISNKFGEYKPPNPLLLLENVVSKITPNITPQELTVYSKEIYENGFAASDILGIKNEKINEQQQIELTIFFESIRKKCYNEELTIILLLGEFKRQLE